MKIILILAAIAAFLYIGGLRISIHPLVITLTAWKILLATIFFIVGLALYSSHFREEGKIEICNEIKKVIDDKKQ